MENVRKSYDRRFSEYQDTINENFFINVSKLSDNFPK